MIDDVSRGSREFIGAAYPYTTGANGTSAMPGSAP